MRLDPRNPYHLLPATLATNPDAVVCLPIFSPHDPNSTLVLSAKLRTRAIPHDLAVEMARRQAESIGSGNGSSDPQIELPTHMVVGRVLLTVPADIAENLHGPVQDRHPIYLFSVHRSVYDAAMRQAESGIVLASAMPTGPGPGTGLVKP